jgi:hypothetical protein
VCRREWLAADGVREGDNKEWDQGKGAAGRSVAKRAEFSSCGRAISCSSSNQQRWSTKLDLGGSQPFDNRHRPTALGAAPKRARGLSRGWFWFGRWWNGAECGEAQRQQTGAAAVGEEAEVTDADEAFGEQVQEEATQELIEC